MRRAFCLALIGLASVTSSASAQSLFGTQGLGMPLEPLDGRTRALGTLGVGLPGIHLGPTGIASAARLPVPAGYLTIQPQWVEGDLAGQNTSTLGIRFPQMGLAYPVPSLGGTAVLHFGSFLDQRWEVQEASTQEFRGTPVQVSDVFKSDGGVSTVTLGWAQRVGEELSLGASVGARVGSVTRAYLRVIEGAEVFETVNFQTGGEWRYKGVTGSFGAQWDPLTALRLAASVTWSGDLKAEPVRGASTEVVRFDLPLEYRFGASGMLTPRLTLSVGASFADWKASEELLGEESLVGSVWSYGGGLEWGGPSLGERNFPFRLGMRRSALPFTFEGEDPKETVFSGGIGLDLIPPQVGLSGGIDLALERGKREAASLSETFWRVTLTFRVGAF